MFSSAMLPASSDEENMIGSIARTPKTFSLRPMVLVGLLSGMVGVFFGTCLAYQLAFGQGRHFQKKTDVASTQGLAAQAAEEDAKEDAEKVADNACVQKLDFFTQKRAILFLEEAKKCRENLYDVQHAHHTEDDPAGLILSSYCNPRHVDAGIELLKDLKATCAPQWSAIQTAVKAEAEVQEEAARRLTAEQAAEEDAQKVEDNACVQKLDVTQKRAMEFLGVAKMCRENFYDVTHAHSYQDDPAGIFVLMACNPHHVDEGIELLQDLKATCAPQWSAMQTAERAEAEVHSESQ